jgi:hypothetical protein
MKNRWRLILPIVGLLLFGAVTQYAVRWNLRMHSRQYFWWSAIRLNTDPLNRHPKPKVAEPCQKTEEPCFSWNPEFIWVEPGLLPSALLLSALPAFAIGDLMVRTLGKLGISELVTFMSSMPLLIAGWYFLVGSLVDWFIYRIRNRSRPVSPLPDDIPFMRP